jgi:hypothetical protein
MADTSDYIPANAIRFDDAFERLFDADSRAPELRTAIDRLVEAIEAEDSGEYEDVMDKWDIVRRELDAFFRQELSYGALIARRRDPYTGEEQKVPPKDWEGIAILPGADLEFPPSYFLGGEFDAWLEKTQGNIKKRGRPPKGRDAVEEARIALWGDAAIREAPSVACDMVIQWLNDNKGTFPSDDTILRGLGIKKTKKK